MQLYYNSFFIWPIICFALYKREETILDILTYMQLSTAGLLLVINSVVG